MHETKTCPVCGNTELVLFDNIPDHSVSKEIFRITKCPGCDLLFTNPRPDDHELSRYYQSDNYISHGSKTNNLINKMYVIARFLTLKSKVRIVKKNAMEGPLLDIGCGTGHFVKVASQSGRTTIGVEPSENARKIALKNNSSIYASLEACHERNFSAITLWHVLEHVPDLKNTLALISEKLHPDGTIFIALPNYASHDGQHYKQYWAGYDVPRHLWHFNRKAVLELIHSSALKLKKIIPMKLDSYYVSLLSERYKQQGRLSLFGYARGILNGLCSNLSARKTRDYSSIIYVIGK